MSIEDVLNVLSNRRRRELIRYFETVSATNRRDLSEDLADRLGKEDQRKSIYISLYQNHLPMLDKTGVVRHNRRKGTVSAGENYETALIALRAVEGVIGNGEIE